MDEKLIQVLRNLADVVIDEVAKNEAFRQKVFAIIGAEAVEKTQPVEQTQPVKKSSKAKKRDPAVLDPLEIIEQGEEVLTERLNALTEKELKDIIAEYAMDPTKSAMRWRKREKLIGKILEVSKERASKGDAFRMS